MFVSGAGFERGQPQIFLRSSVVQRLVDIIEVKDKYYMKKNSTFVCYKGVFYSLYSRTEINIEV